MRSVASFALVVGLACSTNASGQAAASFGAREKVAIEQLFEAYAQAFLSEDFVKLRDYLQAPFLRFGPSNTRAEAGAGDWQLSRTMDEAIAFFQAGRETLKTQGVEKFAWKEVRITALSSDRALVSRTYRRSRKDGTPVLETSSIYVVTRSSGSWKICGIMNQDLGLFGKVF